MGIPVNTDLDLKRIQERRRKIAEEVARLQAEDQELEIALRVFGRYASSMKDGANGHPRKLGPSRPEGIPTLFKMTETVIQAAIAAGKPGLTGREIVAEIGERYWPGVKPSQILPLIYGFSKRGRLRKNNNGIFRLPANESAA
ncbi:MAG: hypothetical protein C5B56_14895 [Proteobacteria bacterium]|nr:MAG: hypothetical protein C5B56_14895 [Pseudomonadota bacterium]